MMNIMIVAHESDVLAEITVETVARLALIVTEYSSNHCIQEQGMFEIVRPLSFSSYGTASSPIIGWSIIDLFLASLN